MTLLAKVGERNRLEREKRYYREWENEKWTVEGEKLVRGEGKGRGEKTRERNRNEKRGSVVREEEMKRGESWEEWKEGEMWRKWNKREGGNMGNKDRER